MKIKKAFMILNLVIAICSFFLIVLFLNWRLVKTNNLHFFLDNIIVRLNKPKNSVISLDEVIPGNFISFGDDISVVGKSKFMILSPSLQKLLEIDHNFKFPVVKNSRFKALLFDADGRNYIVTTKSKVLNKGSLENKIITGKIAEDNVMIFITESNEYCCELRVLSIKGSDIYKYCFAQMYVTDVAVNDAGDKVAVCGLKSEDGVTKSVIKVFDFQHEQAIFSKDFKDNVFFSVNFFDDSNFVAIGNSFTVFLRNLGSNTNEFDYKGKTLCLHSFDKNSGVALSFSPTNDERNQYVVILNKKGRMKSKIETGKCLKSIALRNGKVLGVSESRIFKLKRNNNISNLRKVPTSVKKALWLSGLRACILGNGEISISKV